MKILISDLDGTLVFSKNNSDDKEVKEKDLESILKWQEKGNKFGSCTGRGMKFARRGCENVPFDFVIANSGAYIKLKDGTILVHETIPLTLVKEVMKVAGEDNQFIFITAKDSYVYQPKRDWFFKTLEDISLLPEELDGFSIEFNGDEVLARETLNRLLEVFDDRVGMYQNKDSIDIVAKGCTKGSGVKCIQKYYGLSDEEVAVIGDNYNDLPMFEASVNAYTFNSSPKEVKEKANYLIDSLAECIEDLMGM